MSFRPSRELGRLLLIGLVLSAIAAPLAAIFVGPLLPPGSASDAAHGQQQDNTVMMVVVIPIIIMLALVFGYALVRFRQRTGGLQDGAPVNGHPPTVIAWIAGTVAIVLGLAAWGSYELFPGETGAGGGMGPVPLAVAMPADHSTALPVQVIGQQWAFTYRYPTYGGVETTRLELPVGREIRFTVTSLDVVHSFWADDLGVKADAVPGTSNVVYVKPVKLVSGTVRCAELCGLWHGHMQSPIQVVSAQDFSTWIAGQRRRWALATKALPPYAPTYNPDPPYRAG